MKAILHKGISSLFSFFSYVAHAFTRYGQSERNSTRSSIGTPSGAPRQVVGRTQNIDYRQEC